MTVCLRNDGTCVNSARKSRYSLLSALFARLFNYLFSGHLSAGVSGEPGQTPQKRNGSEHKVLQAVFSQKCYISAKQKMTNASGADGTANHNYQNDDVTMPGVNIALAQAKPHTTANSENGWVFLTYYYS